MPRSLGAAVPHPDTLKGLTDFTANNLTNNRPILRQKGLRPAPCTNIEG